ncbi:hypothetical protein RJT34_33020 [Clitoria ternatea]|uniref:Ribosomal protein L18ae family n=1 Tax=Clitoria ternatea TaxID=43366 RepID=A0AAN9EZ53_CLITE
MRASTKSQEQRDFERYFNSWRSELEAIQSMDKDSKVEETVDLQKKVELVRSVSDKHYDLLRPSARNYSRGQAIDATGHGKGKYALIRDAEDFQTGIYDKPLPFNGCGIGWFSFLFGFVFPPMWYYATILYFGNHYRKDPRERAGLAASAIAALVCSVGLMIIAAIFLLKLWFV